MNTLVNNGAQLVQYSPANLLHSSTKCLPAGWALNWYVCCIRVCCCCCYLC